MNELASQMDACEWNGKNGSGNLVATGVYFYCFDGKASFVEIKKMMLLDEDPL